MLSFSEFTDIFEVDTLLPDPVLVKKYYDLYVKLYTSSTYYKIQPEDFLDFINFIKSEENKKGYVKKEIEVYIDIWINKNIKLDRWDILDL